MEELKKEEKNGGELKRIVGCNYECFLESGGDDWESAVFLCLIGSKERRKKFIKKKSVCRTVGCLLKI